MAVKLIELGCDEVCLSDTAGYANPAQLRRLIRRVHTEIGDDKLCSVHLHNTCGLGLANTVAALEEGITTIDASLGGLGGCPFAPGASGNIVLPGEDMHGFIPSAGLPKGYGAGRKAGWGVAG